MRTLQATILFAMGLILTLAISMPAGARGHGHHGKSRAQHATKAVDEPESIIDVIFGQHDAQREKKARAKKKTPRHFDTWAIYPKPHFTIPDPYDNPDYRLGIDPRNMSGGGR